MLCSANTGVGDFNPIPYPDASSMGGPGYLRFNASEGNTTASICVDINNDVCNEQDETFTVELVGRPEQGVQVGDNGVLTVTIRPRRDTTTDDEASMSIAEVI